jgi:ribosome assembly protein 4
MATLPPPPNKRQKTAAAQRAREQQDIDSIPTDLGSVRIRFFDETTGASIGEPISVPVTHSTTQNLELLVNSLLGHEVNKPYCR